LLLRLAGDTREVEALRLALGERGCNTSGIRGASVDTLVEVIATSSLAQTSLHELERSTAVSDVGLDLELNAIDFRCGSVGV
jgi:hypothetical protein